MKAGSRIAGASVKWVISAALKALVEKCVALQSTRGGFSSTTSKYRIASRSLGIYPYVHLLRKTVA